MLRLSIIFKEEAPMTNNNSDFISLTAAVRRARSEGLELSYSSLRRFVAAGYIPHVPNGSRIFVYYPKRDQFFEEWCDCRAKSSLSAFP